MSIAEAVDDVVSVAHAHVARVDDEGIFPQESVGALRASGLVGLVLPQDAGGLGAGPDELVDVVAAVAEACPSTASILVSHTVAAMMVAVAPPPGLPGLVSDLASGAVLATLAMEEPGPGSLFWAPASRAEPEGSRVSIRARKSRVAGAGHAEVYVVSTGAVSDEPGEVEFFVVEGGTAGLTVGEPAPGLGLRGTVPAPVDLVAAIPVGHRLGAASDGFDLILSTVLPWLNVGGAALSLGIAASATAAAVADTTSSSESRAASATESPLVRSQLARGRIALSANRAYLHEAAATLASAAGYSLMDVLAVKAAADDAALEITDGALRLSSGVGAPAKIVERAFRDARSAAAMAPKADLLYDFYGRNLLGLPMF
ncbi:MAG: hypothetical protein RI885_741 [Actinomycetota bacterium]